MEQLAEPIVTPVRPKLRKRIKVIDVVLVSIILVMILLIKTVTLFPAWIEEKYSMNFYLGLSAFYRSLFGKLPFSLGDILYFLAGIFLVWGIRKAIITILKRRVRFISYTKLFFRTFYIACSVYIFFNLSWGLNYNRLGIAHHLKIEEGEGNIDDLKRINRLLLQKVNQERLMMGGATISYPTYRHMFVQANESYKNTTAAFPFIQYKVPSIKRSLYGRMGNFFGFLGYYNPFTGEAQLNLTMPRFLIPFVTCHEMAHQLGYASESEANFVGYLAAINSPNPLFHYSAYFDLFNYANRELYKRDSVAARQNYVQLDTLVKKDIAELREYWRKSDNYIEPIIRAFYDQYLKANQQDKGVKSYNQVVSWLIAYNKKYNKI